MTSLAHLCACVLRHASAKELILYLPLSAYVCMFLPDCILLVFWLVWAL